MHFLFADIWNLPFYFVFLHENISTEIYFLLLQIIALKNIHIHISRKEAPFTQISTSSSSILLSAIFAQDIFHEGVK